MADKLDPTAALWNRMALTGGRFTKDEEEDHYRRLDEKEGHEGEHEVGGVDLNPFSYLASAGAGAFGGILNKANQDIDDLQREMNKGRKKKKKKRAEPEPEPAPLPPPEVAKPMIRLTRQAIGGLRPWYKRPWVPYAAGAGALGVVLVAIRRR